MADARGNSIVLDDEYEEELEKQRKTKLNVLKRMYRGI